MRRLCCMIVLSLLAAVSHSKEPARIAIVIDDLGYRVDMDRAVLALDDRVAVAIIPHAMGAGAVAAAAAAQGREFLIHLPLSHLQSGCGALVCPKPDWSVEEIYTHLRWADRRVPGAVGLSNHQGSVYTADTEATRKLVQGMLRLKTADRRQLFLIDSRTSPLSQLANTASAAGFRFAERQVFLDHVRGDEAIVKAWRLLLEKAARDGQALAIGHPHPETIAFLNRKIPSLDDGGPRLVEVSQLLQPAPLQAEPASSSHGVQSHP